MQRARAGTGKAEEASPLHSTCPGTSGFWLTPETGPGCGGLGSGRPSGGLCRLAGRRARPWGGFRRCIQHPGGPLSLPSRLCPGIWPWPRTQSPAPAYCSGRGQWAGSSGMRWTLGPSAWPISKPGASRGSSRSLPTRGSCCPRPSQ